MKSKTLLLVLIGLVIFILQATASATTVDLITNGNFSSGLSGWNGFGPYLATVDATGGTLNWDNTVIPTSSGNATGAYQTLSTNVTGYDSLIFKCDIKPISQTLASPGWWGGGIEYPGHIEIDYTDLSDNSNIFQWGFYYLGNGNGTVQGTYVPQDTWYSYTTPQNLLTLPGGIKTVDTVKIYGNGYNYTGSADNVQLLLTKNDVVPEPATMSLLGLGILGLAGLRKKVVPLRGGFALGSRE